MSDITKCGDGRCPSRANCWRFCAPDGASQSYEDFGRRGGAKQCNSMIQVTDKEKRTWRVSGRAMTSAKTGS